MRMQFATGPDPTDLLMLPWSTPLAEWPKEKLVSLPRGISRHVVRFVRIGGIVYAIKEISQGLAEHEYELLRELAKSGIPVVQAVGVVANRMTPEGEPLDAALVTKHLRFSLPYRALFSRRMDPDLETKLLDALAELLVRLHLVGFAWKDCSLSNTLFRRDAGALAAYLVDAETGEMRRAAVQGPARSRTWTSSRPTSPASCWTCRCPGCCPSTIDPLETAISVIERYERLWDLLTAPQTMGEDEWWRIEQRLRKLNELGFDVAQIQINEKDGDPHVMVQTQVVDAGHHRRRLFSLTGIDVQENQARRILNDLDTYRSQAVMPQTEVDEDTVAHHYVTDVYDPVIEAIPRGRWPRSSNRPRFSTRCWSTAGSSRRPPGRRSRWSRPPSRTCTTVLRFRPDEKAFLDSSLMGVGALDADDIEDDADLELGP